MDLQAVEISVVIDGQALVERVSFAVAPGEIVAVVGPNGAGKSTLLKALCGEIAAQGEVIVNGRRRQDWPPRELAKVRAVLPQQSTLAFGFTALEVVLMGRTPHVRGAEGPQDHAIAHQALRLTHTEYLAGRTYTTLSGGERQRVQLARVLAQIWEGEAPRYLLLDEPTNNLDLSHQHGTMATARQFAGRGVGVVAVLHDLNLAAQYADRLLVLQAGRCVSEGRPHDVLTPEVIRAVFQMPVVVQPHPCYDCPLVIPVPRVPGSRPQMSEYSEYEEQLA